MSESSGGGSALLKVGLLLAGAFLLATIYAMWQIGRDRLYTLGLILTCAVAATLVLVALAIIVRMWRRNDAPPVIERHFRDGTVRIIEKHTLDGRAPAQNDIKLLQLPAQPQAGAYPELLRAAYAAGATRLPAHSTSQIDPGYIEGEIEEQDLSDWGAGWDGDIRT